jgi:hypothetical protein
MLPEECSLSGATKLASYKVAWLTAYRFLRKVAWNIKKQQLYVYFNIRLLFMLLKRINCPIYSLQFGNSVDFKLLDLTVFSISSDAVDNSTAATEISCSKLHYVLLYNVE